MLYGVPNLVEAQELHRNTAQFYDLIKYYKAQCSTRLGTPYTCHVRFLTRQRLEKLRREGMTDTTNVQNGRVVGKVPIKEQAPAEKMRTYVNKRTGQTHTVPDGIDPGFEWNPGEARSLSTALMERRNRFDLVFPSPPPQGTAVSAAAIRSVVNEYTEPIQRAMKAINLVHGTGILPKIPIRAGNAKDHHGLFAADAKRSVMIRLTGGDHQALTVLHEIGHFLDFAALTGDGFSSQRPQGGLKRVMKQIRNPPRYKPCKQPPASILITSLTPP